jgi:hypothetical protein
LAFGLAADLAAFRFGAARVLRALVLLRALLAEVLPLLLVLLAMILASALSRVSPRGVLATASST